MRVFPRNGLRNKYNARKMETADGKFDSALEYKRWLYLKELLNLGEIKNLRRQVPYELLPSQKDKNGKVLFRPCRYVADFEYDDTKTGEHIVEDTKGILTDTFKLKEKLLFYIHGIKIRIVKKW